MSIASILQDLTVLGVFLLLGFCIREVCKPVQKLFIPSAVIGGFIALLMGPQVFGVIEMPKAFSGLSSALINLILTCLVFGVTINKKKVESYIDYCCLATGLKGLQLAVGVPLGLLLAKMWPGLDPTWGTMGVFAFLGGHGNAAAVGAAYSKLGIPDNQGLGVVMATIGLLAAILGGLVIINYGVRKGWAKFVSVNDAEQKIRTSGGKAVLPAEKRFAIGTARVLNDSVNNLLFQFSLLMLAMFVGGKFFDLLGAYVHPFFNRMPAIIDGVIGSVIVWPIMQKCGWGDLVDRKTISTISGFCLDIVVLTAVATMRLDLISTYIVPITVYSAFMVIMTAWLCIYYFKKVSEEEWFEKALCAYGMGTGSSATGLALVRAVDPDNKSIAVEAHGVHNGTTALLTSSYFPAAVPLMAVANIWSAAGLGLIYAVGALALGWILLRPRVKKLGLDR